MGNELGAVYTPPDLANLLTKWAIRSPDDKILDLGVGEGAFVFSAYERLIQLGAEKNHAQNQIFGSEVNPSTFEVFLELANRRNLEFPNIVCDDFFETEPFEVDSLVGNPPYVRRHQLTNQKVHKIQSVVKKSNNWLKDKSLSDLTDLYVYFLLHALPFVKNNGRIAVVVADSWLNVRYGKILKKYLNTYFKIDHLISFDRKIFEDAQVKALLLFATKTEDAKRKSQVSFTRVLNGLPIKNLENFINLEPTSHNDLSTKVVQTQKLDCASAWAVHLKSPHLEDACKSHQLLVPLKQLGLTRIGIQSLANDFFLLSPDEAKNMRSRMNIWSHSHNQLHILTIQS